MITSIHVKNYKAFTDASIPIKPLTFFLGENSAGKSSIIQLILMLQQTAEKQRGTYDSALLLNGDCTQRGTEKFLFHNFEVKEPLTIELSIKSDVLAANLKDMKDSFVKDLRFSAYYTPILGLQKWADSSFNSKKIVKTRITEFLNIINRETVKQQKEYLEIIFDKETYFSSLDLKPGNDNELYKAFQYLSELQDFIINHKEKIEFSFTYELSLYEKNKEEKLAIDSLSIKMNQSCIFSIDFVKKEYSSDFVNFPEVDKKLFNQLTGRECTLFEVMDTLESLKIRSLAKTIGVVVTNCIKCFQNEFVGSKICHVSPLRAVPQRYYLLDNSNRANHLDTMNGTAIAEVLLGNSSLKRSVNHWLEKFHVKVDVPKLKEVVYRMQISHKNALSLDITDVGFGISQILPIIVQGFFSKNDSMMVVEQPEIHLHPQMQADLADMFIDMLDESGFSSIYIVETHSEYLLKRLRRRMSEKETGKSIDTNNVAICYFEKEENGDNSTITDLPISENGSFPWPDRFFMGELLKDSLLFLNN